MSISSIRKDYQLQSLSESDVKQDPIGQFGKWWDEAIASSIDEVNAMTLSTVTAEGKPSARIVLLKGFDERGFVFFTNYESNKGAQLTANPFASLVFFWKELERQVRIEGICEKVSEQESDDYFHSRPIGSQLGGLCLPSKPGHRKQAGNREQSGEAAGSIQQHGNTPASALGGIQGSAPFH